MVVGFGTLFNSLEVQRTNSSDEVTEVIKIPLSYGPKDKMLTRISADPSLNPKVALTVPRMGFELTGLKYDATRKLNKLQKTVRVKTSDSTVHQLKYSPVPYEISFSLYSFTATAENGLQIIEQILPYFAPAVSYTHLTLPTSDLV